MGWKEEKIKIDGKWLSNLRFADDTVLLTHSKKELQKMAIEFEEGRKGVGLGNKTKLFLNSKDIGKIRGGSG